MSTLSLTISNRVRALADDTQRELRPQFDRIDAIAARNSEKVLAAFQKHRVAEGCFAATTGYGYDDLGRDKLDAIYADIFGGEDGLVRLQFVNGTHAITAALFGALRPGDQLVYATGAPYDTLQGVIGISGDAPGSLKQFGVEYRQVELTAAGTPDLSAIAFAAGDPRTKAVVVQRSRGYANRAALSVFDIGAIVAAVRAANPAAAVLVDNCYGEFVEETEPTQVGADLVIGSLIKNPGGGLAPTGGYLVGRRDLVDAAAMRLTAPGIGRECGATLGHNRALYQGLFLAPHTVAQAVKTAVFAAAMLEKLGFAVDPPAGEIRRDIIQAVHFGAAEPLQRFCKGIQMGAPVDSYVTPEPWDMPGYECPVIMAAGAFIQGASIELSADGPMRPPYTAYLQGGLTFESGRLGVMLAAEEILRA